VNRPSRRRLGVVVSALAVIVAALSGCSSSHSPGAEAPATPIARLNTAAMEIPRIDFCSRVPHEAVTDALGSSHARLASYGDGDRTAVAGETDTVAEHGCAWLSTTGPALARAWVFASPVDKALARSAITDARNTPGCHLTKSPQFGSPTLTQVCENKGTTRVRHAGLFGSTWLTCEISDSGKLADVRKRTNKWCVQIANTLNTAR